MVSISLIAMQTLLFVISLYHSHGILHSRVDLIPYLLADKTSILHCGTNIDLIHILLNDLMGAIGMQVDLLIQSFVFLVLFQSNSAQDVATLAS